MSDQMKYFEALQRAPKRLAEIITDIMHKPPEQQHQAPTKKHELGK